jgi:hypothetical protein
LYKKIFRGEIKLKLTRILPKKLAIGWQECDLNKIRSKLQYYRTLVRVYEELELEGEEEILTIVKEWN